MITLTNVFLAYSKEFFALYDINLTLKKGDRLGIIGNEGSGRTSLLRAIAGLEPNASGELYIKDIAIKKVDFSTDVSLAFLSSKPVFMERKSVYENLSYIAAGRIKDRDACAKLVNDTLIRFGILSLSGTRVDILTDAERKVVQIARAGLRDLDILLVDNGFEHLSPEDSALVLTKMKILTTNKDLTLIIATALPKALKGLVTDTKHMTFGSLTDEPTK